MLRNTFCHIPGIGPQTEQKFWRAGFTCWDALLGPTEPPRYPARPSCREQLRESVLRYEQRDPAYFAARLPSAQRWRLFADFRDSCAFLDIETTGLGSLSDHITAIALYDGSSVRHFVHGENLKDFPEALARYRLVVTYNGSSFDLPFLQRQFHMVIRQAHIDLRYVLRSLGLGGGLKNCERNLGVSRPGLEDIDGAVAVLLWREYRRHRDRRALETLLAYNVQDAVNLEPLMVEAYNRKLAETPFADSHRLPAPAAFANPFAADAELVRRLLCEIPWVIPLVKS
jgi:uncharacterized protein YprB with RNaseH-like and TPR domain